MTTGSSASLRTAGEARGDDVGVALLLRPRQTLQLLTLDGRVDGERRRRIVVAVGEAVHAHHHEAPTVHLALEVVGGVGDLALEPTLLDGRDHAVEHGAVPERVEMGEDGLSLVLELVSELLDQP